jgi:CBS domain containing-hemolysin-like protein
MDAIWILITMLICLLAEGRCHHALCIFVFRIVSYVFYPVLVILTTITGLFTKHIGEQSQNPSTIREEIMTMLQMPAEKGDIQAMEKDMIRRMFDFSETKGLRFTTERGTPQAIEEVRITC